MHDFKYVPPAEWRPVKERIIDLIHFVQNDVRNRFTFQYQFIGSSSRKMITRDEKSNIGFDFDVNITVNDDDKIYTPKEIKHILMDSFNRFIRRYGYDYCEDSTRVFTIKVKDTHNSCILHSCDFAIVHNYGDKRQEYIRFNKTSHYYSWEEQPQGFYQLPEKEQFCKENYLCQAIRDLYILYRLGCAGTMYVEDACGGQADNAISDEAYATIAVQESVDVKAVIAEMEGALREEYRITDPNLCIETQPAENCSAMLDRDSTDRLICLLQCAPQGVEEMSADIPGLPQTSANLGILRVCPEEIYSEFCVRSAVASQKQMMNQRIECLVKQLGGQAECSVGSPIYCCLALLMEYIKYSPQRHDLSTLKNPGAITGAATRTLTEYEAKQRISGCGIYTGEETLVADLNELRQALPGLKFPLVMKVSSRDILHKTDCGGVELNIQNDKDAEQAFASIMKNCTAHCPEAKIEGVLVGTMAEKGEEIIVGIHNDAQFGPMLLAGLGGIFVELFRDVVLTPCPVSHEEAEDLLASLQSYQLLTGYRGEAAKDVPALVDLMVQISRYAAEHKDLRELDLNPVFVYDQGKGVRVIDALMVLNG